MRMAHGSTLLAMLLILASVNTTAAMLVEDAGEISYQVPRADRIVTGTVTDTQAFYDYTIVTIEVDCWLKNPLPAKAITVMTECGTGVWTGDEASFAANETAILMLKDVDASENRFRMVCGEVGKHPISDRDAILEELERSDRPRRNGSGNSDDAVVRNFPLSPVEFIPPASDRGLDMDGDGLFDYLIVEIDARTSEPGRYYLTGELHVPMVTHEENDKTAVGGSHIIELAPADVYLNESIQTVAINFEGGSIRNDQINGPYEVSSSVNNETYGFGHAFDHTTDTYDYTQFELPDLLLSGQVRSKPDAIELAREKAQELGIEVRAVKHTEIMIDSDRPREVWALDFEGEEFDERFVIYGTDMDEIGHCTMNGTMKGIPAKSVPAINAAGVIAIVALVGALCSRKWGRRT